MAIAAVAQSSLDIVSHKQHVLKAMLSWPQLVALMHGHCIRLCAEALGLEAVNAVLECVSLHDLMDVMSAVNQASGLLLRPLSCCFALYACMHAEQNFSCHEHYTGAARPCTIYVRSTGQCICHSPIAEVVPTCFVHCRTANHLIGQLHMIGRRMCCCGRTSAP